MIYIPIELPSLSNERLHWRKLLRITQNQKKAARKCINVLDIPSPPLIVTITRIGPRRLDDDNLQGACKYVRDVIAEVVGIDDGSTVAYTWVYKQKVGEYGVCVDIKSRMTNLTK